MLGEQGFRKCTLDDSVYVNDKAGVIVATHVDDALVMGMSKREVGSFCEMINKKFKTTEPQWLHEATAEEPLVHLSHALYMAQDEEGCECVVLSMVPYAEAALAKQAVSGEDVHRKGARSLNPQHYKRDYLFAEEAERLDAGGLTKLRSGDGAVGYAAHSGRPDLATPCMVLAEGQAAGTTRHLDVLSGLLVYWYSTKDRVIVWRCAAKGRGRSPFGDNVKVEAYFDADFSSEKPRTGYVMFVDDCMVAWRTMRQTAIAMSTAEAELAAGSFGARETLGLNNLMIEIFRAKTVPVMYGDNEAANLMANNQASLRKIRHIDLAQAFIRDATESSRLKVEYCATLENPANLLTKVLGEKEMLDGIAMMGMRSARGLKPHSGREV
jgi:hypothetical protein